MASFFRTYRTTIDGARIDGVYAMAFIHNGDYHLTHISIYQDGMIDCWGLVDFEELKRKVRSGWVVTQPPKNARISVSFLGSFTATRASYWIEPEAFIKEVADEIEQLNGRPTTSDRCRQRVAGTRDAAVAPSAALQPTGPPFRASQRLRVLGQSRGCTGALGQEGGLR